MTFTITCDHCNTDHTHADESDVFWFTREHDCDPSSSRLHPSHSWGPDEGGDEIDPVRHCTRCGTSTTDEDSREERVCKPSNHQEDSRA